MDEKARNSKSYDSDNEKTTAIVMYPSTSSMSMEELCLKSKKFKEQQSLNPEKKSAKKKFWESFLSKFTKKTESGKSNKEVQTETSNVATRKSKNVSIVYEKNSGQSSVSAETLWPKSTTSGSNCSINCSLSSYGSASASRKLEQFIESLNATIVQLENIIPLQHERVNLQEVMSLLVAARSKLNDNTNHGNDCDQNIGDSNQETLIRNQSISTLQLLFGDHSDCSLKKSMESIQSQQLDKNEEIVKAFSKVRNSLSKMQLLLSPKGDLNKFKKDVKIEPKTSKKLIRNNQKRMENEIDKVVKELLEESGEIKKAAIFSGVKELTKPIIEYPKSIETSNIILICTVIYDEVIDRVIDEIDSKLHEELTERNNTRNLEKDTEFIINGLIENIFFKNNRKLLKIDDQKRFIEHQAEETEKIVYFCHLSLIANSKIPKTSYIFGDTVINKLRKSLQSKRRKEPINDRYKSDSGFSKFGNEKFKHEDVLIYNCSNDDKSIKNVNQRAATPLDFSIKADSDTDEEKILYKIDFIHFDSEENLKFDSISNRSKSKLIEIEPASSLNSSSDSGACAFINTLKNSFNEETSSMASSYFSIKPIRSAKKIDQSLDNYESETEASLNDTDGEMTNFDSFRPEYLYFSSIELNNEQELAEIEKNIEENRKLKGTEQAEKST